MNQKIICNKCGKEFSIWDEQENFVIDTTLGYGTVYDGAKLKLHLCCECMEELIAECSVNPITDI